MPLRPRSWSVPKLDGAATDGAATTFSTVRAQEEESNNAKSTADGLPREGWKKAATCASALSQAEHRRRVRMHFPSPFPTVCAFGSSWIHRLSNIETSAKRSRGRVFGINVAKVVNCVRRCTHPRRPVEGTDESIANRERERKKLTSKPALGETGAPAAIFFLWCERERRRRLRAERGKTRSSTRVRRARQKSFERIGKSLARVVLWRRTCFEHTFFSTNFGVARSYEGPKDEWLLPPSTRR